jgi:hypothetical protein
MFVIIIVRVVVVVVVERNICLKRPKTSFRLSQTDAVIIASEHMWREPRAVCCALGIWYRITPKAFNSYLAI